MRLHGARLNVWRLTKRLGGIEIVVKIKLKTTRGAISISEPLDPLLDIHCGPIGIQVQGIGVDEFPHANHPEIASVHGVQAESPPRPAILQHHFFPCTIVVSSY